MGKTYKIRRSENGKARKTGKTFVNFSLAVPNHIAETVPPGMVFECSMTKDGILFSPSMPEAVTDVPTWAQPNANGKPKAKRATPRKRPGAKPAEPAAAE